ncbi:MAG: hypothetical protein ACM3H8_06425 [Sphingobacteriales bacterium]
MKIIASFFGMISFLSGTTTNISAQTISNDSVKFDYSKIYALCLDANVKPVLALIDYDGTKKISDRNVTFKTDFENRFKYVEDKSIYLSENKPDTDELLKIFRSYWRMSLLDVGKNNDAFLITNLTDFLNKNHLPEKDKLVIGDSIDIYLKRYIESKDMHTTGFGKTGRLFDLLVWKTERDTVYSFTTHKEKISSRVILMDNFVTLGWEEYATLQKYYPGGWAKPDALYCVQKAYDLNSENFLISYLAHESRHFSDYKIFPKLTSPDLEYRAKLTELSMAQKTLYQLIKFFTDNANYNSDNGHSIANYCVIRDLSKKLFKSEFENDLNKWENISVKKINKAAYRILQSNTKALKHKGSDVQKFIKP